MTPASHAAGPAAAQTSCWSAGAAVAGLLGQQSLVCWGTPAGLPGQQSRRDQQLRSSAGAWMQRAWARWISGGRGDLICQQRSNQHMMTHSINEVVDIWRYKRGAGRLARGLRAWPGSRLASAAGRHGIARGAWRAGGGVLFTRRAVAEEEVILGGEERRIGARRGAPARARRPLGGAARRRTRRACRGG